jgi:hypothetical protein
MVNYNLNIPDGPNNPSDDQPLMKENTNSIQTLISVDHVGFNSSGNPPNGVGGHHLQVSFDGKNVPGTQTDPQSVLYTNNIAAPGTYNTASASTISELFYLNQNGTGSAIALPISMIKAFGSFSNTGASLNAWNLVLNSHTANTGIYVFNMPTGIVTGSNYLIIGSSQTTALSPFFASFLSYAITSNVQFTVTWTASGTKVDPAQFSILVMQL